MHIAVDARPLSVPITGIGQYTCAMLTELIDQSPSDWHWHLYSDRPLGQEFRRSDNLTIRTTPFSGRFMSTLIAQLVFPVWALLDRIQIYWSPRHHLPAFFFTRVQKLVTIHDLVWMRYPETMNRMNLWLEGWLMPSAIRRADQVVAVSNSTAEDLTLEFPVCAKKLTVIGNAATKIPKLADARIDSGYLLFVGTLEPRKNLPRLVRAFSRVLQEVPDYRLVIVGGAGWGGEDIIHLVKKLGIERQVQITGYLPDAVLHQYYRQARALVMPSLYEGFGLPLLEAMQYGTPVITSNCSSLPEVAGDGGLLIDPDSDDELLQAMLVIIRDEELRSRLSSQALIQANRFSWKAAAARMLDLLKSI